MNRTSTLVFAVLLFSSIFTLFSPMTFAREVSLFTITSDIFHETKEVRLNLGPNDEIINFIVVNPVKKTLTFQIKDVNSDDGATLDMKGKIRTVWIKAKNFSPTRGGKVTQTYLHNGNKLSLFAHTNQELSFNIIYNGRWQATSTENSDGGKDITYATPRAFDHMYLKKNTNPATGITIGIDYISLDNR